MSTIKILNYTISDDLTLVKLNDKQIINTINPHSYCVAKNDTLFQESLKSSDILLPDGIGIVLAARLLKKEKIIKIAGADVHKLLLENANEYKQKVFYLGASQTTLDLIETRLKKEYPNINVSSYSPPYKNEFSKIDTTEMINAVNTFNPDVLFVGMTAPKQEKWVYQNNKHLNANTIASIGAVFDFYAGTVCRPPQWLINIKLEWLGRLLKEPKRMWKRNFVSTPVFIFDIFKEKHKKSNKNNCNE